jgi:hypothetical protein
MDVHEPVNFVHGETTPLELTNSWAFSRSPTNFDLGYFDEGARGSSQGPTRLRVNSVNDVPGRYKV